MMKQFQMSKCLTACKFACRACISYVLRPVSSNSFAVGIIYTQCSKTLHLHIANHIIHIYGFDHAFLNTYVLWFVCSALSFGGCFGFIARPDKY